MLHFGSLVLACLVRETSTIIDFTGAVTSTCLLFLFPAIGYLAAQRIYGAKRLPGSCLQKFDVWIAWFFIICGIFVLTTWAYSKFVEIRKKERFHSDELPLLNY